MVDTRKLGYSPDWNRLSTSTGYRVIYCPDHPFAWSTGYVYVHRIIAEIKIGRILQPEEKVHHINENKKDNSPENIKILTQSEHSKLHKTTGIIYVTFNCTFCNKTFSRKKYQVHKGKQYCSKKCYHASKKGKPVYLFKKDIPHGVYGKYRKGCRCTLCKKANTDRCRKFKRPRSSVDRTQIS